MLFLVGMILTILMKMVRMGKGGLDPGRATVILICRGARTVLLFIMVLAVPTTFVEHALTIEMDNIFLRGIVS